MVVVYISLGSNIEPRLHYIDRAVKQLQTTQILTQTQLSVILETPAIVPENAPKTWQQPYLNAIIKGYTQLTPLQLLKALKEIEQALGRPQNHPHWGPRTIDLDLLLYAQVSLQTPELTLPHPELNHRWFLLHLLAMLDPELKDLTTGQSFQILAQQALKEGHHSLASVFTLQPKLVGIVNVTPDSFSDGGNYFSPDKALEHCHQLLKAGAYILDIGAQSTRPGALQIDSETEWQRLQPILDALDLKNTPVSIDTYQEKLIQRLLERYPIAWINDVSGRLNNETLKMIAQADCKLCTMHSLSIPPQPGKVCTHLFEELETWSAAQIDLLISCGFTMDNIILDPGIGFGKTPYQTGVLLRHIQRLKHWGCSILMGHSRKSFFNLWGEKEAYQRDMETLTVSQYLQDKVQFLRVHNIALHQHFLSLQQWICPSYEDSSH